MRPQVGVLALQGDFAAHARALEGVGVAVREVRTPDLDHGIRAFHQAGDALFGTCAGAILLASETVPEQKSLALADLTVARNAYGRQRESFEGVAIPVAPLEGPPIPMLFIRAPRLVRLGPAVTALATLNGDVVLAREGRILVATGHPELTGDLRTHAWFAELLPAPIRLPAASGKPLKKKRVEATQETTTPVSRSTTS
jgi:5'-phosphate synthase pdxT subunit